MMPKSFISEEASIDPKHNREESIGWRQKPPTQGWSVKIIPVQKVRTWPAGVDTLPKFAVDGSAVRREETSDKDIGSLIRTFSVGPSKVNMVVPSNVDFLEPKVIEFITPTRTTQAPFRISVNPRGHNSASIGVRPSAAVISPEPSFTLANRPPPMPQPPVPYLPPAASQQCGVAPHFKPCVTSQQASHEEKMQGVIHLVKTKSSYSEASLNKLRQYVWYEFCPQDSELE
ncbi:hypothetical protein ANCCAN_09221 [Ancylostoma caninum]|uniref:Uncharacterized protein n=1 Tax=Ancylostoma caninum TaxID=29170 RepID=A0A368GK76_ANCCA|nr:hypothetical protein ANCCAN_09221 [Ancylostoma caninum]